jgi:hypothetical protein
LQIQKPVTRKSPALNLYVRFGSFTSVQVCPLSGRCGHEFLKKGRDGPEGDIPRKIVGQNPAGWAKATGPAAHIDSQIVLQKPEQSCDAPAMRSGRLVPNLVAERL